MKKKLLTVFGSLALSAVLLVMAAPSIVHGLGLHPDYDGPTYKLPGKKALIIGTNHGVLNKVGETTGAPTGAQASELTHPYYGFLDAGMEVDIASIKGGVIPIDPQTLGRMVATPEDKRYLEDAALKAKLETSIKIADLDFTQYDAIFLSGGWGAAYDLGYSQVLGEKIADAYYAKRPIIGSVCHGALGLIRAKDKTGKPIIAGRKVTGVTDKQIKQLGITLTPMHPESELRKAGALYESQTAFFDIFATHVVIDDEQRFVTGQNQNSSHVTAHKIMEIISKRP
jgi:putative intracellular protease/amidase|tara:strand:- start:2954 stop:3805 length:852 start_codon:yes stop_codon:yes gene_type:complete